MTHNEIMLMTNDELDYAVAVAQGWIKSGIVIPCWVNQNKYVVDVANYHPSRNGNQLLEIMNRELISVMPCAPNLWEAEKAIRNGNEDSFYIAHGKTINQAVLRCYLQGGNNG